MIGPLKNLIGRRVIVTRGMKEPGYENHQLWVAGLIPKGATGTIHCELARRCGQPDYPHYHVIWDDPALKAKKGYNYAITEDTDFLALLASGESSAE